MKKLLLVDGSNIVMRAAFGGDIEPERAVQIATGLIGRAIKQVQATHMVICMDSQAITWRKMLYPQYKGDRTLDTTPWLRQAHESWARAGWYVDECAGFEADDIIATIAGRSVQSSDVVALSNDSDILSLSSLGVRILKPVNGGTFILLTESDICKKYEIKSSEFITDLKAMVGEKSDNVPGVPGIGPVRAAALLNKYGNLGMIIFSGERPDACKHSKQVYECRAVAQLAFELVTLREDVPIPPIKPANCKIKT